MEDFNRTLRVPLEDDSPEGKQAACAQVIENMRKALRDEGIDPDLYEIYITETKVVEDEDSG
jgi:predicted signal transduction protein with EAL and GGDEF domain